MSNLKKSAFKSDIDTKIKANGTRAITGTVHNSVLTNIKDSFLFYVPLTDTAERDALVSADKYAGMIVWVNDDERPYFVESDLSTWHKILNQGDIQSLIDTSVTGITGRIFSPVADLTALKALDTTSSSTWPDNGIIVVKSLGTYRLDRSSVSAGDDNRVVQPTTGVGRWLKIASTTFDHNNLFNAQGGTTNEYYHLTAAQHTLIQDTLDKRHTQNTDTILDEGGANETTVIELRDAIDNDIPELQGWVTRLFQIKTVSIDYQITLNDRTILVDCSTGNREITLPNVINADGYDFIIKKIDSTANTVTIVPFESNASYSITEDPEFVMVEFDGEIVLNIQGEVANLQSDGEDWYLWA